MFKLFVFCLYFFLLLNIGMAQKDESSRIIPLNETFTQLNSVTNPDRTPLTITPRKSPQKPTSYSLKPGDSHNAIEVKFLDNLNIEIGTKGYPVDRMAKSLKFYQIISLFENISQAGGRWKRMAGAPEEKIDSLRAVAEMKLGRAIANLNNYFILTVPKGVSIKEWIDQLNALPEVEIALPLPLPPPPPLPPNFQELQGYLNPATDGIDASYAWTLPGGTGTNTTICDLEYAWNLNHQDLPANIVTWIPPGYTASNPFDNNNHGTAVLGQLVSLNNGWGTTGAVYGATATVAPTYLNNEWSLGTAMTYAISNMVPGDVILIEQQMAGPRYTGNPPGTQFGLIPVEWWQSWYNVILTAVGNGIHVVAAAGNGQQNLDDPIYSTGNYGHWPFLPQNNSGAIIVGAGSAPTAFGGSDVPRSRLWFSNYGSRVDLQGWGNRVTTTGYGGLYNAEGINLLYTATFGGTSSASPIVAAAVALVESHFEYLYPSQTISPLTMRNILKNTGSPQQSGTYPATQNIGPLPNVQSALQFALAFSVSPTNISYGNVFEGSSKQDSVIVTNTGTATLTISSVTSNNAEFTVTPTSGSLAPSASRKFYITFSPTSTGEKRGDIIFTHNAVGSPDTVSVNGMGVAIPNSISGVNFDDLNGNGIKDSGEPGLQGWKIYLTGSKVDSMLTGTNGIYKFDNLLVGNYVVSSESRAGWRITKPTPSNSYTINITQSGTTEIDKDFGNFKLAVISGKVFTDLNHNGSLDAGEPGLAGMRVDLRGNNPLNNQSITTNETGLYSFDSFIDVYVASTGIPPKQYFTVPSAKEYHINVNTSGMEFTNRHFGLSWLTDSIMYRSFLPESLVQLDALGKIPKAVKRKPIGGYWEFKLAHDKPQPIREMHIDFAVDVILSKMRVEPSPFVTIYGEKKKVSFVNGSWHAGDTITIKGYSSKGKPQLIKKIWYGPRSVTPATNLKPTFEYLELPMPTYANFISEIFAAGGFAADGGLLIGTKGDPKKFGWVLISKDKDVQKSLRAGALVHSGSQKFFSKFYDGKIFVGQQSSLPPTKQNNRLFAELVALKLAIVASSLERTNPGFGELIYENQGNPLNGLMVKQIFNLASAAMTSRVGDSTNFYNVIRQINLAFNGKFDTSKFATRTELTNVRYLADVPYLRSNPEVPIEKISPVENYYAETPSVFELAQNYPNPFNPSTTIQFILPEDAFITLKVYNILGQEVATLINHEYYTEGMNEVEFDAGSLASGIYFYHIKAEGTGETPNLYSQVKKMILVK